MRTHGWSGSAPATDEEAISRILDAASQAIDARGSDFSIADVARTLGVTRQTVYRYFPSTDALLVAAAVHAASGFQERLAAHLRGITDPAEAVTEAVATALEWLPEGQAPRPAHHARPAEPTHRVGDVGDRAGLRPLDGSQIRRRLGRPRIQRRRSRRTVRAPAADHPVVRHRPRPPAATGRRTSCLPEAMGRRGYISVGRADDHNTVSGRDFRSSNTHDAPATELDTPRPPAIPLPRCRFR